MRVIGSHLDRAIDVIELLAEQPSGERLSAIAQRLALPKSAVHRLLAPLCARGWAEQDEASGRYRLSLRLAALGQGLLYASRLPELCQPVLERLARESRELVRLTLVQGEHLIWIGSAQGAPPGLMYQPAMTGAVALHATANGKAWLATLGDAEALRIARARGFAAAGPRAVRNADALAAELARTRARGFGLAEEEAEPGVTAVAVAIVPNGLARAVGTVSVAGPVVRMIPTRYEPLAALLRASAAEMARLWPLAPAPATRASLGGA